MLMKRIFYLLFIVSMALTSCSKYEPFVDDDGTEKSDDTKDDNTTPTTPVVTTGQLPRLSVQGRYLKNEEGKVVNLHGVTQTYSSYFNESAWTDYDVSGCLTYNKKMLDGAIAAGWKMNFVRMHLDPYWSDDTGKTYVRYEGHERFSESRFKKYLSELFIPMAKYFVSKGYYVVMRPPGVCPEQMAIGDSYHKFLKQVWDILSQDEYIKNNTDIMFELANEPISMLGTDGQYAHWTEASWQNATTFFQEVIDVIRGNGCTANVIWVPGLCWQMQYKGYAKYRLSDANMGFAVHCYPGWYGSDCEKITDDVAGTVETVDNGGYTSFKAGWDENVGCVAEFAPIMVTEIDWAPAKYGKTWGKGVTGTAAGSGFGANFKKIADDSGNVSWLYFTTTWSDLVNFKPEAPSDGVYTFLNDPEACPWQMYHWFKEYAEGN